MDARKDVEQQKQNAMVKEVQKDFFNKRDKGNRGAAGLVDNASKILSSEAEVKEMLYQDSIKDKPVPVGTEPMFNTMFLTARRNKLTNEAGLYLPTASFGADGSTDLEQDFASEQKVIAVGPQCQQVKVDMIVKINTDNFKRRLDKTMAEKVNKEYEYVMPIVTINDVDYIRVSERDVDYIIDNLVKEIEVIGTEEVKV
jgi:hypothetical protein